MQHYQQRGIDTVDVDDIWLGNGVSELITMALQAMLDNGDEVLVPAPDYPLWTASTSLAGGTPVHYLCDESAGWLPDLDDLRVEDHPAHQGDRRHQPEQPDRRGLPRTRYWRRSPSSPASTTWSCSPTRSTTRSSTTTRMHIPFAAVAPDLFTLTFNGLSKAYRLAGFRVRLADGRPARSSTRRSYLEGLTILANMRLCANVPGQHAIQIALGGRQSIRDLVLPGGRLLEQRDAAIARAARRSPG